ncbi:ABC transporter permease [soil metagenome]
MRAPALPGRLGALAEELGKMPAFFRRDLLSSWSYRMAFFGEWISLFLQVLVFGFVSRLIRPETMPSYGGERVDYLAFVAVGLAITSFMQLGLGRVVSAIRQEQLMGTLEAILMTPTTPSTIQLGSVAWDLLYVPLRTVVFFGLVSGVLGVNMTWSGLLPSLVVLLAFIPFIWGLGVISAAGVVTFRRGTTIVGIGGILLTLASGAYFPVNVLPDWLQLVARYNPITICLDTMRSALLGGTGWEGVWTTVGFTLPAAAVVLVVGTTSFNIALRRERRRGSLGLY